MSSTGGKRGQASRSRAGQSDGWRAASLLPAAVACLWLLPLSGCDRHAQTAQVEQARKQLQLNRPQRAVELLAKDDSAEGHYLKSVALQSLGDRTAAREQIEESLSIVSDSPKYKGYQALLDLAGGKSEAAQRLIDLFELHPSSPGVAFFATRGFTVKKNIDGALRSFKLGLNLVDEVPEFMFQVLQHAVTTEQFEAAEKLLSKLELAAPTDAEFLKELLKVAIKAKLTKPAEHILRQITKLTPDAPDLAELEIRMDLMLGRPEAAVTAARKAISSAPQEIIIEALLAEALLQVEPKPAHERELAELAAKHPEQPDFIARYAKYLINLQRLPEAVAQLNQAIRKCKSPALRATLFNLVIRLPLEAGDATVAQQQLDLHRSKFAFPLGAEYFMGRILYVQRDFSGALARFQKVIDAPEVANSEAGRALAGECLFWQRKILASQAIDDRLKAAQDEVKNLTQKKAAAQQPEKKGAAKSGGQ